MAKTKTKKQAPRAKAKKSAGKTLSRAERIVARHAAKPGPKKAAGKKSTAKSTAKSPATKKAVTKKAVTKKAVKSPKAATKKAATKKLAKAATKKAATKKLAKSATKKAAKATKSVTKKAATKKAVTRKTAPRKTAPAKATRKGVAKRGSVRGASPSLPAQEGELQVYSLAELVRRHGSASEEAVMALIDAERSELLALGAAVVTTRIETDAARLYGQASDFLRTATPELRAQLIGITDDFLRIACWAAQRGSSLHAERSAALDSRTRARALDKSEAGIARRDAMLLREQLFRALRVLSGGKSTRIAEVEIAYGTAGDGSELAKSLRAMSLVGRRYLKDPTLKARAALLGLGEAPFTTAEFLARELAQKADLAEAVHPTGGEVSQADVDLWDGINLILLRHTIELFAAGHARNPAIPSLNPIALRGVNGIPGTRGRKAKSAAPPKDPSTPTPTKPGPT